tara:strand:- start:934 stop:2301 length:1368 start_codon:yes stop_codon:yes gene_type:complete
MALTKVTSGMVNPDPTDASNLASGTVPTARMPSTGTSWQAVTTAATLTAVAGNGYPIDTTSNACTVTLPASASVGDTLEFVDYSGNWNTNNVTLNPNGLKIKGSTNNGIMSIAREGVRFVYVDATQGWAAITSRTDGSISGYTATGGTKTINGLYTVHTFLSSGDFEVTVGTKDVDVMVVAGGGSGGGRHGGGGGSAGMVVKTAHSTSVATYPVVIGAGAASPSPATGVGTNGSNATVFGLTAVGGGGGGTYPSPGTGIDGGSGGGGMGDTPNNPGGASTQSSAGTPSGGTVTAYGNAGGIGYHGPGDSRMDGGGGGAGAVGGTGGVNDAPYIGGAGGVGIQLDYDGNNYYWAAGGGGGMWAGPAASTYPGGAGGVGGGGGGGTAHTGGDGPGGAGGGTAINTGLAGATGGTSAGGNAGANTGSGGGGGGQGASSGYDGGGGAGGSGCVIIRYLT